jgi:hypothetical protein
VSQMRSHSLLRSCWLSASSSAQSSGATQEWFNNSLIKMALEFENDQFNVLEKAILQWFVENYKDENLTAQIRAAKLKGRKWTRVGSYIELDIPMDARPVDPDKLRSKDPSKNSTRKGWPIDGPEIRSEDIEHGGGSLLWGKGGQVTSIEMYAYGRFFRENITNFELHEIGYLDSKK